MPGELSIEAMDRDEAIVALRVAGKSLREITMLTGATRAEINAVVDRAAQAALSPSARIRSVFLAQARVNELLPIFQNQARSGDCQSAIVVVKLLEREAISIGLGGLHHPDPVELAKEAAPRLTSTEALEKVVSEFRLRDPRRLRNGGPGYSVPGWPDWRDDEDRAYLAGGDDAERKRAAEEK